MSQAGVYAMVNIEYLSLQMTRFGCFLRCLIWAFRSPLQIIFWKENIMNKQQITKIEKAIGYEFKCKALLIQAYTRRSFTEENPGEANNEILETLGDAAINLYVAYMIVSKCRIKPIPFHELRTQISEGILTEMRKEIVCGANLAKHAKRLKLIDPEYMRLGNGDRLCRVYEQPSVQEDLLESIVGAVVIDLEEVGDFGVMAADNPLLKLIRRLLDVDNFDVSRFLSPHSWEVPAHGMDDDTDNFNEPNDLDKLFEECLFRRSVHVAGSNPINALQELCQAHVIPAPIYKDEGGMDGSWTYSVTIPQKKMYFSAMASTKKEAKMRAATKLYNEISKGK